MAYQREFASRVRVGVVGVGSHAYRNVLPALTYLPVELVAVADVNNELGLLTAQQYGLQRCYGTASEMYSNEQLDAVLLVVSPQLHPELAIEAFRAGLHVWMEKPAAANVADVDRMLEAQGDRIACVGYKKVFMPATLKVLELIASGHLDPLRTILAQYPMSIPSDTGLISRKEGSNWLSNGCHPLSFLLAVGGPVETVAVHRGVENSGVLILRHTGGALSNLHLALGAPTSQPFERYSVFGGSASIQIDNGRKITYQRGIPFNYRETTSFAPEGTDSGALVWEAQDALSTLENRPEFTQGLTAGLTNFLDGVRANTQPPLAGLTFARQIAAVYEAAIGADGSEAKIEANAL